MKQDKSPLSAFMSVFNIPSNSVIGTNSSFVCAHCSAYADHRWGNVSVAEIAFSANHSSSRPVGKTKIALALCEACKSETVFVDRMVVYPQLVDAPNAHDDMPVEIAHDFEEARQIARRSPRGAAALLRLAIQKLCPLLGATAHNIDKAIGELVAKGTIGIELQQALDAVRVIGNEAVHPGTLDLQDDYDTVRMLFNLVNFIIERGISEPKKIAAFYATLPPKKVAAIEARNEKAAAKVGDAE